MGAVPIVAADLSNQSQIDLESPMVSERSEVKIQKYCQTFLV